MKAEAAKAIVAEMVEEMLKCERYTVQDFKNRWPFHPGTFGDLLTQAEDIMRSEHGIEFRPGPHGTRQVATYTETLNRSKRQRKAGLNKLARSAVRAEVAAKSAPKEQREAIEKTADLQKLQLLQCKKQGCRADNGVRCEPYCVVSAGGSRSSSYLGEHIPVRLGSPQST